MGNESEYNKQLSEIHEILTESRCTFAGGGTPALVWGVLTAVAVALNFKARALHLDPLMIWAGHNLLGWSAMLILFRHAFKEQGRVSLRSRYTLYTWGVMTLAIWLSVFMLLKFAPDSDLLIFTDIGLFVGMGIFVTGLIGESRFSQILGILLLAGEPALALSGLGGRSPLVALSGLVAAILIWGLGSWLVREK